MDETRWMVYVEIEGKRGHRWWLWVVVTKETVCYLIEPSRSGEVVRNHLPESAEGILNADRYCAYKTLSEKIKIAYCWSHIRRDFLRVEEGYQKLGEWASEWIKRIGELFEENGERVKVAVGSQEFENKDQGVRKKIAEMKQTLDRELCQESLHSAQRKVLESLSNHWQGATIFVEHPEIPMDNNESERRLRNPIIGRKNYYGSGSIWSASLSACLFTIFQTLLKNEIDPKQWLTSYFEACARKGGKVPEEIDRYLPWNLQADQKLAWSYPQQRAP
jgi:transposase